MDDSTHGGHEYDDGYEPVPDGTPVTWTIQRVDATGSGEGFDQQDAVTTDGYAQAMFRGTTKAGDKFRVKVKIKGHEVSSGLLLIEPGPAASAVFSSNAGITAPVEGTEFLVHVDVKDAFGNPVRDGTGVAWFDEGLTALRPGLNDNSATVNGQAFARCRKGPVTEDPKPWLEVVVDDFHKLYEVDLSPVQAVLTTDKTELNVALQEVALLTVSFTSQAGGTPLPDGTPVEWKTTNGSFMNAQAVLTAGQATAQLRSGTAYGGKRGEAVVTAQIGAGSFGAMANIPFTNSLPSVDMKPAYFLRDEASQAALEIYGYPNGRARISTPSSGLQVVANYPLDAIVVVLGYRVVLDTAYSNEGFATSGVAAAEGKLFFNGAGDHIGIPHSGLLQTRKGLRVSITAGPGAVPGSSSRTPRAPGFEECILNKAGEYEISVIHAADRMGQVRLTLALSGVGTQTLTSDPLSLDQDVTIVGELLNGIMALEAGGQRKELTVGSAASLPLTTSPIGLGARVEGTVLGGFTAEAHFLGSLSSFSVAVQPRFRMVGLDANDEIALDANGRATVYLEADELLAPEDVNINPEDADRRVERHVLNITIFGAPSSNEPEVDDFTEAFSLRKRQFTMLKDGMGQISQTVTGAVDGLFRFVLPIDAVEELASLPAQDHVDYKKVTFAVANVALGVLGPLGKGGKLLFLKKGGKGSLALAKLYRGAIIARNGATIIVFAEMLETVYQLGEAAMERFSQIAPSEDALVKLNLLYLEIHS